MQRIEEEEECDFVVIFGVNIIQLPGPNLTNLWKLTLCLKCEGKAKNWGHERIKMNPLKPDFKTYDMPKVIFLELMGNNPLRLEINL